MIQSDIVLCTNEDAFKLEVTMNHLVMTHIVQSLHKQILKMSFQQVVIHGQQAYQHVSAVGTYRVVVCHMIAQQSCSM